MSQPMRILLSLIVGLVGGVLLARTAPGFAGAGASIAEPIGGLFKRARLVTGRRRHEQDAGLTHRYTMRN